MLRAVLDASVYISAIIQPAGTPGRLVERFLRDASFEVVVSPAIVDEALKALNYPKVRKLLRGADAQFEDLAVLADLVAGAQQLSGVCVDPDDDKYVAAALEGRAAYVVTGDRAFLRLKEQLVGAHLLDRTLLQKTEIDEPLAGIGRAGLLTATAVAYELVVQELLQVALLFKKSCYIELPQIQPRGHCCGVFLGSAEGQRLTPIRVLGGQELTAHLERARGFVVADLHLTWRLYYVHVNGPLLKLTRLSIGQDPREVPAVRHREERHGHGWLASARAQLVDVLSERGEVLLQLAGVGGE